MIGKHSMEFSGYFEQEHSGVKCHVGMVHIQLAGEDSKPLRRMEHGEESGRDSLLFSQEKTS